MKPACDDLIQALKSPDAMRTFTLTQWDRIVPQARAAGLLGRLGALADQHGTHVRLARRRCGMNWKPDLPSLPGKR